MSFAISIGARIRKSPYFDRTVSDGVTAFTTYNRTYMPTSYGDLQGEYWRLIKGVSLWDVACERQIEISGPDAAQLTQYLVPRDLSNCKVGQGKYVPICNHQGYLLNDPVLLRVEEDRFWLSIADSGVLFWAEAIAGERGFDVTVQEPDVSPLAIQGPMAEDVTADLFGDWVRDLKYFWFQQTELEGIPLIVARSGWSKQGGFELYLMDGSRGGDLWDLVKEAGAPYGIAAGTPNVIERIESGLISYGTDTIPRANPFEMGMGRYVDVDLDVDFIGKSALREVARQGPGRAFVGLVWPGETGPACENPWGVFHEGRQVGFVTAAQFSPRLEQFIAASILDVSVAGGAEADRPPVTIETPDGPVTAAIRDFPLC